MHTLDDRQSDEPASTPPPKWVPLLDWSALLLLGLAANVVVFGGFRGEVAGIRLSVRSWERLAIAAVLIIAIRHAYVRTPSMPRKYWAKLSSLRRTEEWREVWPAFIATRLGVLMAGYLAVVTIGFEAPRTRSDDILADLPARWDALWYLSIVTDGYQWDGNPRTQQNVVFFPAFPAAIRIVGWFLGKQWLHAGLLLALAAFFCALLYLYRLARDVLGPEKAGIAVWALAAYPFSVYYSAPYTEAFYLLGSVGTFYHVGKNQWWRGACWGFFAAVSRPNGFLIALPVAILVVPEIVRRRRVLLSASAAVLAPIVGILTYSYFLHVRFDDAMAWRKGQEAWGRVYVGVWPSIRALWIDRYDAIATDGFYHYSVTHPYDVFHTTAALFALASVWPTIRRFGLAYGAFTAANIVPPLLVGGMMSIGRMSSVLFPAFLWLGAILPARHTPAWIAIFCVLQGLIAVLFFTWRPVF